MSSETFLAWDGAEYPSPPPDGWSSRSDGRWWPEGSGPPEAPEPVFPEPVAPVPLVPRTALVPAPIAPLQVAAPPPAAPVPAAAPQWASVQPAAPVAARVGVRTDVLPFYFDGGAATYFGTAILSSLVIICTFGIATPFAIVLFERWKAKHTFVEGRRLIFTGTGMSLFGRWLLWLLLMIVTFGIYSFWVIPRLTKWRVECLAFDPRG